MKTLFALTTSLGAGAAGATCCTGAASLPMGLAGGIAAAVCVTMKVIDRTNPTHWTTRIKPLFIFGFELETWDMRN
jgi:hypothetical protein